MTTEAVRRVLAQFGYRLQFREHTWTECLVTGPEETVRGDGSSRPAALDSALKQLFPTQIASALFEQALLQALPPEEELPVLGPRETAARIVLPERDGASSGVALSLAPGAFRAAAHADEALEALHILSERIDAARPELAWSTAPRQRLAILAWICEARSHTDLFPEDAGVRDMVARISRQLTEIGKAFWPGSVTALQLQMQPMDLPKHLLGETPTTWARAAELAESALHLLEHEDERRGLDAYGWGDASALEPKPDAPQAILDRLVQAVEDSWGPLDRFAEPRNPEDLPDPALYRQWVRELRWIRGTSIDPDVWARVMGRLRWWACRRNGPVQEEGRELEPGYRPSASWSELLGVRPAGEGSGQLDRLLQEAAAKCRGQRLLAVCTRRDPEEQARVQSMLPGATWTWRLFDAGMASELKQEGALSDWDVVLGAVGLQSSDMDLLLARAALAERKPYLRVNQGRADSCVRMLAAAEA